MALVQSAWALGQKQAPVSREAGGVVCERYTFTVTSNLADGDIIELGILPAYHTVVDAVLVVDEAGTATYDVGIMSGVVGDPSSSRTCGNEFFAGAADATTTRITKAAGLRLASSGSDRSVGVKVVGAGITAANQVIDLILFTKQ